MVYLMNKYLFSQIAVIIATIFLGLTYFSKDRKKILILFILYSAFYGIHYLLLEAITGFFMNIVSIIRNIIFFRNELKNKKNNIKFLILLFLIIIFSTVFTYKDLFSVLLMIASLISTYSVWQNNHKLYKYLAVIVSICFVIYGIHIKSLFGVLTEISLLIAEFIGIILMNLKSKREIN